MVAGQVSPRDREVIIDTVRGEGRALSLPFSSWVFGREAADTSVACLKDRTPWSCVASEIRGKDRLVIVEIDSDRGAGAPMTLVTAHLLTAGAEDESLASRNCAMCNEDALKRTVSDLCRDPAARPPAPAHRIAVHTTPAGARLTLDGAPAAPATPWPPIPASTPSPPARQPRAGDPQWSRSMPDRRCRNRPRAGSGQQRPALAVPAKPRDRRRRRGDRGRRPHGRIRSGPQPRGPQRAHCDTAMAGTAALIAGVFVASAGLYYAMRPAASSMATVAPVPGGAAIGWAGRF
jgi:hypothetical protein